MPGRQGVLALAMVVLASAFPARAAEPGRVVVCPVKAAGCNIASLAEGLAAAKPGSVIVLAPGVYHEAGVLRASGVTLVAQPGARINDVAAEGKAALVIKGDDTTIDGLECSGVAVPDRNGACVRLEGRNLTVRGVNFHDSEEGILTGPQGGVVTVEDSRFERLGAAGQAHGIYVGAIDQLIIRHSLFLASRDEGHEVKSRAARTFIEGSVIASLDGRDSRLVDVPNGGELVIRDSVLEEGPASANEDVIGFGLEGIKYRINSTTLSGCTILLDRSRSRLYHGTASLILRETRVIGGVKPEMAGVTWYPDRVTAGLPSYPALTAPGVPDPTSADAVQRQK